MAPVERQLSQALCARIAQCRTAVLPGARKPLRIGRDHVGYVADEIAAGLDGYARCAADGLVIDPGDAARLDEVAAGLADRHGFRMRGELFDVRSRIDGPVLAVLDRGALPAFGVIGVGVHLNGYVRRADGIHLWIARRSAHKKLDPGKLDNIVGGGVSAGMTPFETLVKEAAEEASIPATMVRAARAVSRIAYDMERPEGLRRDLLVCYDLELPEGFRPAIADGEVEAFELIPAGAALALVASTDEMKFNVNLVLIDFLLRHGLVPDPDGTVCTALGAMPPGRAGA